MKKQKLIWGTLSLVLFALAALAAAPASLAEFAGRANGVAQEQQELAVLEWDLTNDFRVSPDQANPNPDNYGNEPWYFMHGTRGTQPIGFLFLNDFRSDILGIDGLQGWIGAEPTGYQNDGLPTVQMNTTGAPIVFDPLAIHPPDVIIGHPGSVEPLAVGWKSPTSGIISISGGVQDLNSLCGDGIEWKLLRDGHRLAAGSISNGGQQDFQAVPAAEQLQSLWVNKLDYIWLVISAGDTHICDATQLDLSIEMNPQSQTSVKQWNAGQDFRIEQAHQNPGPDRYQHEDVWSYMESESLERKPAQYSLVTTYDTEIIGVPGLEGWVGDYEAGPYHDQLPSFFKNTTNQSQLPESPIPPDAFVMHPTPSKDAVLAWRSPYSGIAKIAGGVTDLNPECGDGVKWFIDKGKSNLASGAIANGGAQTFGAGTGGSALASIPMTAGAYLYLAVDPNADFLCDWTQVDLTITMDFSYPLPTYTPDGDWIYCAKQNGTCTLPGTRLVRYGANGRYLFKNLSGSFVCSTAFSSDPIPGVAKSCHYNKNAGAPLPTSTFTPTYTPTQTFTPTQTPTLTATPTVIVEACTKKPKELEPADGAAVSGPEVILKWREAGCADRYDIQIVRVSDDQVVVNKSGHTKARYTFKQGVAGETYAWQVRACNVSGCGAWTNPRQFMIQP